LRSSAKELITRIDRKVASAVAIVVLPAAAANFQDFLIKMEFISTQQ